MSNVIQSGEAQTIDMTAREIDQNPDAPRLFVDGVQGFAVNQQQIVSFNLFEDLFRSLPVGPIPPSDVAPIRRVSARLVMTLPQFLAIRDWMVAVGRSLEEAGVRAAPDASRSE